MEEEVKETLPEIYNAITSLVSPPVEWESIRTSIAKLNWFEEDPEKDNEILCSVWNMVDQWSLALLEEEPHFLLISLNRVKLHLIKLVHNVSTQKEKVKGIIAESSLLLKNLLFFKKAKQLMNDAVNDKNIHEKFKEIHSVYEKLKKEYSYIFLGLEKHFVSEIKHKLGDLLDEQFNIHVAKPFKDQLKQDQGLLSTLSYFDRVYMPVYSAYVFGGALARENCYFGEVANSRTRTGFGRITYANGDVYEGEWLNDKPSGKGLYIWNDQGLSLIHI